MIYGRPPCLKHLYLKVPILHQRSEFGLIPYLFYITASVIANYWYLKVNFLSPENLL